MREHFYLLENQKLRKVDVNIKTLIEQHSQQATNSIPDWMIGCFKRRSISFASGETDIDTHVFWLQGRNLTIDLRLPIESEMVANQSWEQCPAEALYQLANYEGWSAESTWEGNQLSWSGGTSFQIHNRWPEPAILSRVGDCMIEASPFESYIEDWRIKSRELGALLSLELISEENLTTGELRHQGGALIINGDWAGLVLGRSSELELDKHTQLRDHVKQGSADIPFLKQVFNFETSVAKGNLTEGFNINFSTMPTRVGESLFELDGFEFDEENNEVLQFFKEGVQQIKRRFSIDTIEAEFAYSGTTEWHEKSKKWFDTEQETIGRYLQKLT